MSVFRKIDDNQMIIMREPHDLISCGLQTKLHMYFRTVGSKKGWKIPKWIVRRTDNTMNKRTKDKQT